MITRIPSHSVLSPSAQSWTKWLKLVLVPPRSETELMISSHSSSLLRSYIGSGSGSGGGLGGGGVGSLGGVAGRGGRGCLNKVRQSVRQFFYFPH